MERETADRLFIGTSGWNYFHWKGIFYPEDLPQSRWLEYYGKFFNCVELNVTFYRLAQKKTFQNWYKRTDKDFYFVAKGSRFITHIKRLRDIEEPFGIFMDNVALLKEKLAGILWQFPPSFKKDINLLEGFLRLVTKTGLRHTFEFRNDTWFDNEVIDLFKRYNACLCIADSNRFPCCKKMTADFIYLRFHGAKSLYSSNYSDTELRRWCSVVRRAGMKKAVFIFFNNDAYGYAVKNALRFRELLEERLI